MRAADRHRLQKMLLPAALPCAVALLLGATTFGGDFVFDDTHIVRDNSRLESLWLIPGFFVDSYWGDFAPESGLYRPLTLTTFALESSLFGRDSAAPFHAGNMLLYALCAGLVTVVASKLGARPWVASCAGLLFACHPVHVEVVAGLVGRSELGAALFLMGALANEIHHGRERWKGCWRSAGITAGCVLGALFFKESAIAVFPVLLLLPLLESSTLYRDTSLWQRVARGAAGRWRSWALLVAALALWMLLRAATIQGVSPEPLILNNELAHRGALGRMAGALELSVRYFRTLLWPWPASADYSYPALIPSASPDAALPLFGLLLWCGIALAAWWTRERTPLAAVGLVLAIFSLLPVANIIFPIGTIFAERLLFTPSVGFALVAAATAAWLGETRGAWRHGAVALVAAAALTGGFGFFLGARDWQDERSVAEAIVRAQPRSAKGHSKLGWELYKEGRDSTPRDEKLLLRGCQELERALELYPIEDAFVDTHLNLSIVYTDLGRLEDAERMAEEVYRRTPARIRSVRVLAAARGQVKKYRESIELCELGLTVEPGDDALLRLRDQGINGLLASGEFAAAVEACDRILAGDPFSPDHVLMRFQGLGQAGEHKKALAGLNEILDLKPGHPARLRLEPRFGELHNVRGMIWKQRGEHGRAGRDFTAAVEHSPGNLVPLSNRVQSLIELSRFDEARQDIDRIAARHGEATVGKLRELWETRRRGG